MFMAFLAGVNMILAISNLKNGWVDHDGTKMVTGGIQLLLMVICLWIAWLRENE